MLRTARALNHRVAVLGAGGGIGQPLSLLLKQAPTVSHLALFDVANPHGVAEDLSHICSPSKTSWAHGMDNIGDALRGAQVVVIPAGVPRKPGMTRDDLFAINAKILHGLGSAIADHCPEAHVCVISNPVNSMVPLVAEVLTQKGVFNPKTLYGVTTLDVVRAKTFLGELQHADPRGVAVDVVGGHAGTTIVPVLGPHGVSGEMREALTHDIQFGGDKVVKAKDGAGSATLSMAWSGAHFTLRLIDALSGSAQVEECCFVQTNVAPGLPWFSSRVHLGMHGVERVYSLDEVNLDTEDRKRVAGMTADLAGQITKGEDFAKNFK